MPSTSPYQNNDYQAVSSFRPYVLPINDIFKSISAQNAYWDEGAAKVKNVYDNALELKLSLEPNKQIRDQFMKDAEKEITKLSTMNLADPSVQRQGFGIFKPLFKDEGIVSDDAATRHIEKVNNTALGFRQKDNGKGYNFYNHQYALLGSKEFKNSQDRMAGKKYLENAKEYEPYYDYTSDMTKALKDCHPSSNVQQSPNYNKSDDGSTSMTGYSYYNSIKTLSAEQARVCIEGGMSPAGLRQLQIEGAVSYTNNKETLARDTVSMLTGINENSQAALAQLAARKMQIEEDSGKLFTPEQKTTLLKALDEQIKGITNDITDNTLVMNKLNNNDLSPINENYDQYAGSVYTFRKLYKRAAAAAYEETERKYLGDDVQTADIKFRNDMTLRDIDFRYDVALENIKQENANWRDANGAGGASESPFKRDASGRTIINPNLEPQQQNLLGGGEKEPDPKAYPAIQSQIANFNSSNETNNLKLYNEIITRGDRDEAFRNTLMAGFDYHDGWENFKKYTANNRFFSNKTKEAIGIHQTVWFKAYFPLNEKDEMFNSWAQKESQIQIGLQTLNKKVEIAEKEVAIAVGGNQEQKITEAIKNIKPQSGVTATEMANALLGKPSRIKIERVGPGANTFGDLTSGGFGGVTNIYLDDVKVKDDNLYKLKDQVLSKIKVPLQEINDTRAKVYSTLGFNRDRFFLTYDDKSGFIKSIKSAFPENDKPNEKISVLASDFAGSVKINHPGAKKGEKNERINNTYRNTLGIGTEVEIPEDGIVILRNTKYNLLPQAINNPILRDVAFQLGTVAETRDFKNTQPGKKVENADITIPVWQNGNRKDATIEIHNTGSGPEYQLYIQGQTLTDPILRSTNSYDFLEQLNTLPVTVNKPLK